jgi:branched-chain amino acid aminotransferase
MAAEYAKENKLNDCLVLNTKDHIADSTIANLFTIKNRIICTPALDEGPVNGVTRKYLLEKLRTAGYSIQEGVVTREEVGQADEVFLTNAINGIRWVRQCGKNYYANQETTRIYNDFIRTIWS